ncbi:MAG: hypothetical protein RJB38_1809 [Pseudomonadota bacterium]|jgi:hypothetical protein
MNCFDWNIASSEYLDGSLSPPLKKAADDHLESCADCKERHQHYRLILESLRSLPRSVAPSELQHEIQLFSGTSRAPMVAEFFLRFWPTFQRTIRSPKALTLTLSLMLTFALLSGLPQIRSIYEKRIQKRFQSYHFGELPLSQEGGTSAESSGAETVSEDFSDDFGESESDSGGLIPISSEEGSNSETVDSKASKVLADVWRFTIRTDSPQKVRSQVTQALLQAGTLAGSRYVHGFTAPGGIQFDALVPSASVEALQQKLSSLSQESTEENFPTGAFTWYRNRSKRPLPPGASRVIVWLSLM